MKNLNPQNQENPWILNRVNKKKATAGHIMWAEYQRRRIFGLILDWKPEHLTQGQFNSCSPATVGDLRLEEAVHEP